MGRRTLRDVKLILLAILISSIRLQVWPQVAFRGRLFTGATGEGPVNVRINIESYSSREELLQLYQHLSVHDLDGFRTTFRQMKKGTMSFPQSSGLFIQFHAAVEHFTDKGVRIFLATEAQSAIPDTRKTQAWQSRFLLVVLDLDKNFKGGGKIYEDAALKFSEQDIEMVSSSSVPKMLTGIQPVK